MAWRMGAGPRLLGKQGKRLRLVQLAEHRPPAPALLPQLAGGRGLHMKCPGGIRPKKRPVLWSGGHHTNVTRAEGGGVPLGTTAACCLRAAFSAARISASRWLVVRCSLARRCASFILRDGGVGAGEGGKGRRWADCSLQAPMKAWPGGGGREQVGPAGPSRATPVCTCGCCMAASTPLQLSACSALQPAAQQLTGRTWQRPMRR